MPDPHPPPKWPNNARAALTLTFDNMGEAQGSDVLVEAYVRQIEEVIEKGGFLSLLFHPFLTDDEERTQALETVLKHLVERREEGSLWIARCKDVEEWVRSHPGILGSDPGWDNRSWR